MKLWLGKIPLSTRGMESVETEINIFSAAYNIKRLSSILTYDELAAKLIALNGKMAHLTKILTLTGRNIFKKWILPPVAVISHDTSILKNQLFAA